MKLDKQVLILATTVLLVPSLVFAADATSQGDVDARLQRIEQILNNRQQLDTVNQLIQLQESVEQISGELDVQSRTLKEMESRQQMLYKDVDARLQLLERKASPPVPGLTSIDSGENAASAASTSSTAPSASTNSSAPLSSAAAEVLSAPASAAGSVPLAPKEGLETTAADAMQEQAAYQQAYQLLLNKSYPPAITGFNNYLSTYPQGRYRANAYYWLGEVYLIQNQPQQAQESFNKVITDYPNNPKAGDALLKLGFSYASLGDTEQAKTILNQVIKKYPNTAIADLAQTRLAEL
jgi:tol-pal system protein YbgF